MQLPAHPRCVASLSRVSRTSCDALASLRAFEVISTVSPTNTESAESVSRMVGTRLTTTRFSFSSCTPLT